MAEDLQGTNGAPSPDDQPDYPDAPDAGLWRGRRLPRRQPRLGPQRGREDRKRGPGFDRPAPAWGALDGADHEGGPVPGGTPEMPPPVGRTGGTESWGVPAREPAPPQPPPTGGGPHRPSNSTGPWATNSAPEEMTIGTAMTGRGGLARAAATRRWRRGRVDRNGPGGGRRGGRHRARPSVTTGPPPGLRPTALLYSRPTVKA